MPKIIPTNVRTGAYIHPDAWDVVDDHGTISIGEDTISTPLPLIITELNVGADGIGWIIVTEGYDTVTTGYTLSLDTDTIHYYTELHVE